MTAPGLAWQAYLKKSGVELELLTDSDMLLMVEEGIQSGICEAKLRHTKANNIHMTNHNKSKDPSYIQYYDANSLYAWAMSQKLPVGGFKACVCYFHQLIAL